MRVEFERPQTERCNARRGLTHPLDLTKKGAEMQPTKIIPQFDAPTIRSMFAQIRVDGECWEWIGARSAQGYGVAKVNRIPLLAHRVFYFHLVGELHDGLVIDHLCRNHACVNPFHLEEVTIAENTYRGLALSAANRHVVACPAGHLYDTENVYIDKRGSRHCRECSRQRTREWRKVRRLQSSCKRGHPLTEDNLLPANGGMSRRCKTCTREHEALRVLQMRAQREAAAGDLQEGAA